MNSPTRRKPMTKAAAAATFFTVFATTAVLVAVLTGCSGDVAISGGAWDDPTATTPGMGGNEPTPDNTPIPTACGGQTIPIQLQHNDEIPDLHVVVDKSQSMSTPVTLFDFFTSKWKVMSETLTALVSSFSGRIRFGLTLYPADESCGAGTIDVPMAMGNEPQIQQRLATAAPAGWTPTHTSLSSVRSYLRTVPPGKGPRYVLLATDGIPNCGGEPETQTPNESLAEVQALAAEGINVFVVGFGDIVMANPMLLDQLAVAGGRPNPSGPSRFYPATNAAELRDAMFAIAAGIVPPPCTYNLTSQPEDPERVTVSFDGVPVPRTLSNASGWNYSAGTTQITFFGDACAQLRTGAVKQVSFVFGCTGPVIR